jgi:hypothetical protein
MEDYAYEGGGCDEDAAVQLGECACEGFVFLVVEFAAVVDFVVCHCGEDEYR